VERKIFGPPKGAVMAEGKILINKHLHNLYCSRNIIKVKKPWRVMRKTCSKNFDGNHETKAALRGFRASERGSDYRKNNITH
jgi:hypothetical protein